MERWEEQRAASLAAAHARLSGMRFAVARAVLRRRRLLAALLAGAAVLTGLRAVAPPPEPLVLVQVGRRDLPSGTRLTSEDLTRVGFRAGTAPKDRLENAAGRVLAGPISRGEPVTEVRLVGAGLAAAAPGTTPTPVRISDAATADLLRVGDLVDLWAADPQGGAAVELARDAPVLALPGPVEDDTLPGRLVILGLDSAAAGSVAGTSVTHFLTVTWSR